MHRTSTRQRKMSRLFKIERARYAVVICLSCFALYHAAHGIITGTDWIGRKFPGVVVLGNNLVPTVWLPGWEGFERGIRFGDVIRSADGHRLQDGDELYAYAASLGEGTPVRYEVDRRGRILEFTVPVSVFTFKDYLILFCAITLFGIFFYFTGLVVFFLKPRSAAGWAFMFNAVLVGITLITVPDYVTWHGNIIELVTLPFIGPSFVLLGLYFPEPLSWRKPVMWTVFGTAVPIAAAYVYTFDDIERYLVADKAMLIHLSVCNAIAAFVMGRSFYSSRDPLTRQKAKVVIWGFFLTFMGSTPFVIGTLILKHMAFFWFLPVSLMMLPLSIGYAILARNLFDVDRLIRNTISYGLATGFALLLLFIIMGTLSLALQSVTGQSSRLAAVVSTLLVALAFRPLYHNTGRLIDRRFFKARFEYRETLQKGGRIFASIIELSELLNMVLDTVMDALKVENGAVLLRDRERDYFETVAERDYSDQGSFSFAEEEGEAERIPVGAAHPLMLRLEREGKPLDLQGLEGLGGEHDKLISGLMHKRGFVLLVPVIYEKTLIGALGLGPKRSGAFYSSEEVELVHTLMIQTAVSIENARKVEKLKTMVELETSYRDLKALDELKDNFLSMVSHDLRTPMTGIQGYAYILKDMVRDEQQKKYLEVILSQSDRLLRLINDLLDIQKFESGRMEMEFEDLDLRTVVVMTADAFDGAVRGKDVILQRELPESEVKVRGNGDRLQQALANLISNAIKFSPDKGKVTVRLGVSNRGGQSAARVSVSDQGPGIPADLHDKLFTKFGQVHKEAREKLQGSGLGLVLARQIIESHDGSVGFTTEPGAGSEFFFLLPLAEEGASAEDR